MDQCQPSSFNSVPFMYILNAAALTKPFALEHLTADLLCNRSEVAVITKTHFKATHTNEVVNIDGQVTLCIAAIGMEGVVVAYLCMSDLAFSLQSGGFLFMTVYTKYSMGARR